MRFLLEDFTPRCIRELVAKPLVIGGSWINQMQCAQGMTLREYGGRMRIIEVPHPRAGGCEELLGFNVIVSFHSIEAIVIALLDTTMRSYYTWD